MYNVSDDLAYGDREGYRVHLVATVLRNLVVDSSSTLHHIVELDGELVDESTGVSNSFLIGEHKQALRFIFLCAYANHSGLQHLALETLSLLRVPLFHSMGSVLRDLFLNLIGSDDRSMLMRGLQMMKSLCETPLSTTLSSLRPSCSEVTHSGMQDYATFLSSLPSSVFSTITSILYLRDMHLVVLAMDTLYTLSCLGSKVCHSLLRKTTSDSTSQFQTRVGLHEPDTVLASLFSMLTREAQAMGSDSLIRVRVMQAHGSSSLLGATAASRAPIPIVPTSKNSLISRESSKPSVPAGSGDTLKSSTKMSIPPLVPVTRRLSSLYLPTLPHSPGLSTVSTPSASASLTPGHVITAVTSSSSLFAPLESDSESASVSIVTPSNSQTTTAVSASFVTGLVSSGQHVYHIQPAQSGLQSSFVSPLSTQLLSTVQRMLPQNLGSIHAKPSAITLSCSPGQLLQIRSTTGCPPIANQAIFAQVLTPSTPSASVSLIVKPGLPCPRLPTNSQMIDQSTLPPVFSQAVISSDNCVQTNGIASQPHLLPQQGSSSSSSPVTHKRFFSLSADGSPARLSGATISLTSEARQEFCSRWLRSNYVFHSLSSVPRVQIYADYQKAIQRVFASSNSLSAVEFHNEVK
ncbi:unnamed protein product [Protopolystoma xenopodis]|uniref:RFX-type winged-helix domain-containing protein n=1 Tax=Protopolystoma xenopodis TaxID=117903 RepID=A0A448WS35_9PLAT|nr:unnamed protein product [Protopolystoma xenopodis]